MNRSKWSLRRLILGLSVEDAQSKFDTPESRSILRVAHERYNQGIYHELQVAQRQRNGLAPERKCHISRFTKPSVPGFQAYLKGAPDDYVIREVWDDDEDVVIGESGALRTKSKVALSHSSAISNAPTVSSKIKQEQDAFRMTKALILKTLASALQLVMENVLSELKGRRQSGTLLSKEHQASVVNRLISGVVDSSARSYKSLSSSSHLLEPVEMAVTLFGRKDVAEVQAFDSDTFAVPAAEKDISYSLWVAGGIVASEELMEDFPFHLAKFVTPEKGSAPPHRLPHVEVEIYFSSELFQLEKTIGLNGVHMLRLFIGKTMMKQHEPTPTSTTLLLAASGEKERDLYSIYDSTRDRGEVRIPWIRKMVTKVSTVTGVVFSAEDSDENPSVDHMRASVSSVWRAWGHLVKDLHVHGDLDYLYVSISRQQEWEGNKAYISELKKLEAARDADESAGPLVETANIARTLSRSSAAEFAAAGFAGKARKLYLPISADFVVVECTLERKGLPHSMVVEDIVSILTEMQHEQMEMQRLSVLDAMATQVENEAKSGSCTSVARSRDKIVPVLYEPKVVVSHAGTLENGTHAFQRVRIRGSCRAHVEALAAALQDEAGSYFTDRSLPLSMTSATHTATGSSEDQNDQAGGWSLPKNLSFRAVRAPSSQQRLIGHSAPSASAVGNKLGDPTSRSRYSRSQTLTLAADSSALVTDDERQFWKENYYRLSEIKGIYHDRVDATDALGHSWQSLPPRVHEHLALLNRRLAPGDGAAGSGTTATDQDQDDEGDIPASGKRKRKRDGKKKAKQTTADKETAAAASLGLAPEKLFEYLCTDMEAESARHDLRAGDCAGYDYLLNLRRIPDKHLPLVAPAVVSVTSKGFINYYGPQRFATYTRMNMHPGLHLLKGQYKAAAHVLVQQFYLDAALEAERQRTGQAFPRLKGLQGYGGVRLPDFLRSGTPRSIAEHGTPMHRVLYNALQASALLGGDDSLDGNDGLRGQGHGSSEPGWGALAAASGERRGKSQSRASGAAHHVDRDSAAGAAHAGGSDDPCAEAFLRVIGPRVCAMLIQEFLSFVWNDIVNQRFQRYGTFTLLPGDLVRAGGVMAATLHNGHEGDAAMDPPLVYASRGEIERGVFSVWDLALPLPGADIRLPQNHTEDLYVVTLQRYGLPFDPESRQWRCFKPSPLARHGGEPRRARAAAEGGSPSGAPLSPYYNLTSTFALMEEELGSRTPITDALPLYVERQGGRFGGNDDALQADVGLDAVDMRPDLRAGSGNSLGLTISASYRHALVRPNADTMQWRLLKGVVGDPYQRWGLTTQAQVRPLDAVQLASTSFAADAQPAWIFPSLSGEVTSINGRGVPQLLNVESGVSLEKEEVEDGPDDDAAGRPNLPQVTPTGAEASQRNSFTRGTSPLATPAARTAAGYLHQRCWNGTSQLLREPLSARNLLASSSETKQQLTRRRRAPPAPSWLPRHHGSVLQLRLRLPAGVYPGMLVRELLKMDVNTPDVVDLDRATSSSSRTDRRAQSWQDLTADQRATYQKWIAKRRQQRRFLQQPRAISLALLHQQIFRSNGIRQSLLPTLRSYDSVSK
ncbi:putative tRNA pseudouridine synthase D (TruD) [Leishmania utingensis]|uniref:tRNA pseudouridine synthase D (TruD) n=1 Tax=Leishmania utingensis TaxID=653362 RepID=A0AAW3AIE5_9TRYP